MDEGRSLREHKDMRAALDWFQRADEIMHVPTTAYEVARTQAAMGLTVEALDTIARILHTPVGPHEPGPFGRAQERASARGLSDRTRAGPDDHRCGSSARWRPRPSRSTMSRSTRRHWACRSASTPGITSSRRRHTERPGARKWTCKMVRLRRRVGRARPKRTRRSSEGFDRRRARRERGAKTPEHGGSHPLAYAGFGVAAAGFIVGTITGGDDAFDEELAVTRVQRLQAVPAERVRGLEPSQHARDDVDHRVCRGGRRRDRGGRRIVRRRQTKVRHPRPRSRRGSPRDGGRKRALLDWRSRYCAVKSRLTGGALFGPAFMCVDAL